MAPYFIWQSQRPEPFYRHKVMQDFYSNNELTPFHKIHSLTGFAPQTLLKVFQGVRFFAGIALLPPLIMLRRVLLDRRIRFLLVCVLVLMAGMAVEIFLFPQYLAPFTAAFYAIGLQAMRHLRLWRAGGQPVGMVLVRLTVAACVILAGLRLFAEPLHLKLSSWPAGWSAEWYGPGPHGAARARVEASLERLKGPQLAIVRYAPNHLSVDEWVYNAPDIDGSKVIWARDMDPAANLELIRYYKDRTIWLVQPDLNPAKISPYYPPSPLTVSSVPEKPGSELR
jgi:hypothetical protein